MPPFAPGTPKYVGEILETGITALGLNQRFGTIDSVLAYGAVGDGVTDDTTAINAALTACANKSCVIFPQGYSFLITNSLNIPANSYVIIHGLIKKANFTGPSNTQFNMIQPMGSYITIEGDGIGIVDGNYTNQGGAQATFANGICTVYSGTYQQFTPISPETLYTNIFIRNLTVQNTWNGQICICAQNSLIEGCVMQNSHGSSVIIASKNTHFVNCWGINIGDDGVGLYQGNQYCSVRGCVVTGCFTGAFILTDSPYDPSGINTSNTNCALLNNICYGNSNAGIFVAGLSTNIQSNIVISGNVCYNNGSVGNYDISYIANAIITGNFGGMSAYQPVCVSLGAGLNNIKISENIFQGYGSIILKLANDITGNAAVVIDNNLFFDDTLSGSQAAIQLNCTVSSQYVTLRDNDYSGNFATIFVDNSPTKAAIYRGPLAANNTGNLSFMNQSLDLNNGTTNTISLSASSGDAQFNGQVNTGALQASGNITAAAYTVSAESLVATGGFLTLTGIATTDPHVAGRVWLNGTYLSVSAG